MSENLELSQPQRSAEGSEAFIKTASQTSVSIYFGSFPVLPQIPSTHPMESQHSLPVRVYFPGKLTYNSWQI